MQRLALRRLSLLLVVLLVAAPSVPRLARAADAVDEASEDEIDAFATEDEPVEEVDEKDVVVLTEKTFNDTVLKAKFALVRLSTPPAAAGMMTVRLKSSLRRWCARAGRVLRTVVRTLPGASRSESPCTVQYALAAPIPTTSVHPPRPHSKSPNEGCILVSYAV